MSQFMERLIHLEDTELLLDMYYIIDGISGNLRIGREVIVAGEYNIVEVVDGVVTSTVVVDNDDLAVIVEVDPEGNFMLPAVYEGAILYKAVLEFKYYRGFPKDRILSGGGKEGQKGDPGVNFNPDAIGYLIDRSLYDVEPEGFSFLAIDTSEGNLYFRIGSGWSDPVPFRGLQGSKGNKGDTGDPGAEIELEVAGGDILWKYSDIEDWSPLISLSELKGDQGDKGDTGEKGDTGNRGLTWKGEYSTSITYNKDDAVFYLGSSYIVLEDDPEGIPGSGSDWEIIALKGDIDSSAFVEDIDNKFKGITGIDSVVPEKTISELKQELEDILNNRIDNYAIISGYCNAGIITGPVLIPFEVLWISHNISYDSTSKRFTIQQDGIYQITMNPFKNSGNFAFRVKIGKNMDNPDISSTIGMCYSNVSTYDMCSLNAVISLVEGDYICFRLHEGQLYANEVFNQFSIIRIY